MRSAPLLLVVAACGGKAATSSPATLDNQPGDGQVVGAPSACPPMPALREAVERHWQTTFGPQHSIDCVPGRFGEPGYLLEVEVEPADGPSGDDSSPRAGTLILAADLSRALLDGGLEEIPWGMFESYDTAAQVHDLDRDGVDEVIDVWSSDRHGEMESGLLVLRVRDGAFVTVGTVLLSSDNAAAIISDDLASLALRSCDSTWQIVPRDDADVISVVSSWSEGDPADGSCLPPGTHVFALVGDQLTEARP